MRNPWLSSLAVAVTWIALAAGATADDAASTPLCLEEPQPLAVLAICEATCTYGPPISCSGTTCSAQDDPGGYVICDGVRQNCPSVPPLSVSLVETNCRILGDKSIYTLKATASGGTGSYSFTWYGANQSSTHTANPNYATTVLLGNPLTVQVNVTSGSQSASKSRTLYPGCF